MLIEHIDVKYFSVNKLRSIKESQDESEQRRNRRSEIRSWYGRRLRTLTEGQQLYDQTKTKWLHKIEKIWQNLEEMLKQGIPNDLRQCKIIKRISFIAMRHTKLYVDFTSFLHRTGIKESAEASDNHTSIIRTNKSLIQFTCNQIDQHEKLLTDSKFVKSVKSHGTHSSNISIIQRTRAKSKAAENKKKIASQRQQAELNATLTILENEKETETVKVELEALELGELDIAEPVEKLFDVAGPVDHFQRTANYVLRQTTLQDPLSVQMATLPQSTLNGNAPIFEKKLEETDIRKEHALLAEQKQIAEAASQRRQAELNATLTILENEKEAEAVKAELEALELGELDIAEPVETLFDVAGPFEHFQRTANYVLRQTTLQDPLSVPMAPYLNLH
ncbi:unnamed protein product [Mytilus coruscus]|uniref:Uncharacterized protein n=1 Tax=Mytilus coruscus TaxID=42192 RepID=A0A6J8EXQ3_MYTCO|nr:unnamed protein product [Mytilus coruscus]